MRATVGCWIVAVAVLLSLVYRGDGAGRTPPVLPPLSEGASRPATFPPPQMVGPTPDVLVRLEHAAAAARLSYIATLEQQTFAGPEAAARDLWELGLAQIAASRPGPGVDTLEIAARREPLNARLATDLGAAYYLRASHDRVAEDLVKSLDASARAVRLEPEIQQAHYNLAIALERLGWQSEASLARARAGNLRAASDWPAAAAHAALDVPPSSAETLRTLEDAQVAGAWATLRQRAKDDPEAARAYVEASVLSGIAEALPHETRGCEVWSRTAQTLGAAVAESTGDRLLVDLAQDLHDGCGMDAPARRQFAEALGAVRGAQALVDAGEMGRALALLTMSEGVLRGTRALAGISTLWRILAEFSLEHPSRLLARIGDARGAATRRSHLYLLGRLQLVEGSVALRLARRTEALERYQQAVETFQRLREFEYTASTMALVAQSLKEQGQYLQAWSWMADSLLLADRIASPRRRFFVLFNAASTAVEAGLFDAAAVFGRSLLEIADEWDDPTGWSSALALNADIEGRLGRGEAARDALTAARERAGTLTDAAYRRQFEAQIAFTEGIISHRATPAAAVAALSTALSYFHQHGMQHRLAATYLWRGRAYANGGRVDAAENDWRRGIEILEDQRPQIRDEQLRISHLSSLWDLYGEMITSLAVRRGRPAEAFDFVERSKARALLDSVPPHERFHLRNRAEIVRQLPADVVVVQYSSLADVLLIEVQTRTARQHVQVPIARPQLDALVSQFRHQIMAGLPDEATASRLHVLLFGSIAEPLRGRRVVVVPDGALGSVPFSALQDPATGRRVVQDVAVALAPSVALLGVASERLNRLHDQAERAFVVGDPGAGDAARYGLRALPGATREAAEVANLYPASVLSDGVRATRREFLAGLQRATIVHFAGHAVADPRVPSRSFLLLGAADEDAGDGRVFPSDVATLRLTRTRLAVLSACSTAAGAPDRGEGVLNLARPFLMAGVPQVVGTLWDVDDVATRRLLVGFHERVRGGEDVIAALRHAQVERLMAPGVKPETRSWAAVVVMGGVHGTD